MFKQVKQFPFFFFFYYLRKDIWIIAWTLRRFFFFFFRNKTPEYRRENCDEQSEDLWEIAEWKENAENSYNMDM